WHGRLARAGDRLDACPTQTGTFDLVEAAAGNGRLSRDVLDHLAAHAPDVHRSIRLHLVERSPTARSSQRGVLGPHSDRLTTSAADVPEAIRGLIFANELLDALPPHLVVMRTGGLREVFVTASGDRLHTVEAEPSSSRLGAYLDHVRARLEPGWFAEVNLAAIDWIRRAAERLQAGFLLLIDYGHEAPSLFSASRRGGTLTAYHRHTSEGRDDGPSWLAEPGERDITSHVDLTGVRLAAEAAGLTTLGIIDQGYFLLGLGLADRLFESSDPSPRGLARRLALKSLLLPAGLGSTHKVLVFARGLGQPTLAGFSFARRLT
ncbi:MAG TPA: SAM-dependent methyltransferase, partial [Vicinamibacterales bacterium]